MHSPFGLSVHSPTVLSGLHLLLVEDDEDTREIFTYTLETRGAEVTSVGLAGAALDAMDLLRFDVLIVDIQLPDEDGYWLIDQVRSLAPERGGRTPAVAVTAFVGPESGARTLAAGFQAFVPKPIEIAEIVGVIVMLARHVDEYRGLLEGFCSSADEQRTRHAELETLLTELETLLADRERSRADGKQVRT